MSKSSPVTPYNLLAEEFENNRIKTDSLDEWLELFLAEAETFDFEPFRQAKLVVFEHPFTTRLHDNWEADRYSWPGCTASFGDRMRREYSLVWHHLEARPAQSPGLELLPSDLHKALQHTGGYAVKKTVRMQLDD